MHGVTANTTINSRGRFVRLLLFVCVSAGSLVWWAGCSVEKHYELLNKFFDGVPDPNAPNKYDGRVIAQSSTYTEHQPYIDEACFECHTDPSNMILENADSRMCMGCHDDIQERYAFMHGAVTGNACLMCHNPHISALPNLLRDDSADMCKQCHDLDPENRSPAHADLDRSCIQCHSGHGGSVQYFLHQQPSVAPFIEQEESVETAPQEREQKEEAYVP